MTFLFDRPGNKKMRGVRLNANEARKHVAEMGKGNPNMTLSGARSGHNAAMALIPIVITAAGLMLAANWATDIGNDINKAQQKHNERQQQMLKEAGLNLSHAGSSGAVMRQSDNTFVLTGTPGQLTACGAADDARADLKTGHTLNQRGPSGIC